MRSLTTAALIVVFTSYYTNTRPVNMSNSARGGESQPRHNDSNDHAAGPQMWLIARRVIWVPAAVLAASAIAV